MNHEQPVDVNAPPSSTAEVHEVKFSKNLLGRLTFFALCAIVPLIGGSFFAGIMLFFVTIITVVFGVIGLTLIAPAAIAVSLISDSLQLPPYHPSLQSGSIYKFALGSFDLYTKFGLPVFALGVALFVVPEQVSALHRWAKGEGWKTKMAESDFFNEAQVVGFGLAAALCWYNRLTRAQNEGQLPSFNAWLSTGCIALLFVLLSNLPDVLAGRSSTAETEPFLSEDKDKPPGYRATECEEVVVEKVEPETSAML